MAVKVKTYLNPSKWSDRKDDYDEIINSVHICATKSVCDGIVKKYNNINKPVITISQIRDTIFSFWFSSERRLQLYLEISRLLNDSSSCFTSSNYLFIRKNLRVLIDTILELRFIGISPLHFEEAQLNGKEQAMVALWTKCVLKSKIFIHLSTSLEKILDSPVKIKKLLNNNFSINIERDLIMLQGFYFITPEQQVILKCLERYGRGVTFFNLYDDRYKKTFDFIKKFINDEHGWSSEWLLESKIGYREKSIGSDFLNIFEGKKPQSKKRGTSIREYPDFNVFLQQVIMPVRQMDADKRPRIVSTSADILNGILDTYYPERKGGNVENIHNYIKYPIGKFLINLHDIYDSGKYIVNYMHVVELFASGFLVGTSTIPNANKLVKQLYDIKTYCGNCETIDEWIQRIKQLKQFNNEVLSKFTTDDTRMAISSSHPFKRLSYANVTLDDIDNIIHHLNAIKKIVRYLFGEGEITRINDHFTKVRELLNRLLRVKDVSTDDIDILTRLLESLSDIDSDIPCYYDDIKDALAHYLSGADKEDEEPQIIPFIEVDGLAFEKNEKISKLYLTGLDEGGLPLSKYDMPYPLSERTVESLGSYNKKIRFLKYRNESIKEISRYLLYIALEFLGVDKIELSWIRNFADKENLDVSIYMALMGMQKETIPVIYKEPKFITNEENGMHLKKDIQFNLFPDYVMEYNFCNRRFLYSYILNSHSDFTESFNQKFIYGELAKIVMRITESEDDAIQALRTIFPQWDNTFLKWNALRQKDYLGDTHPGSTIFKGAKVDNHRYRMVFPGIKNNRLCEIQSKNADIDERIKNSLISGVFTNTNTQECFYCPELWHCPLAKLEVDDENE